MKNFFQLFSRRNEEPVKKHYDPEKQKPAIRCSICTGEQVAGFRNRHSGQFTAVTLITGPADLQDFCSRYGVSDPKRIY